RGHSRPALGEPARAFSRVPRNPHSGAVTQINASANTAWIFSSAARIFTRCCSAPCTAARRPSSPAVANVTDLALGVLVVVFAGRPGPRFLAPPVFALTL